MGLRDINFKEDYRSGYDDIVTELYRPCLKQATMYWRAVGYFSSSSLEAFGAPLGAFVRNGGTIRLVTSVELSKSDLQAIRDGQSRQLVCQNRIDRILDEEFSDGMGDGTARLCSLLQMGRLDLLIAVPKSGTGIYHEKIGVFFDNDVYVAFTGSSNESRNAFENNRECIDVYPSWTSTSRAARKRAHFEDLWQKQDKGVETYSFPEAAKRKLLRIYKDTRSTSKHLHSNLNKKWRHQDEAVEIFIKSERGVLNMATGTGKTRTALKIISALSNSRKIDTIIVATDGTDLLDQWYEELLVARHQLSRSANLYRDYYTNKQVQDFLLAPSNSILLVSRRAGTNRDPLASALDGLSTSQGNRCLLIHDEVHKLGSPSARRRLANLSDHIRFRLGLSATPEREYDNEGNLFIQDHIGKELTLFELPDAIRRGILAPFDYYPLTYELSDHDRDRVRSVYRKKAARAASGDPMSDEEVWIDISRVYKTSLSKLPVFREFIANRADLLKRCIIFVETKEYGMEVLEIVHEHRADFHTYFTGEQSGTLKRFADADLECLITCHRVSEGIDIQSVNSVILFSSARARLETIQRIGRCLRTDPDNPSKIAQIVDFIRPSDTEALEPNNDEERRDWLSEISEVRADHK